MRILEAHNLQLCMAIVFSFLNFVPLFNPSFYKAPNDDYVSNQPVDPFLFQSFIAPLIVSLIPGIDLIFDLIPSVSQTEIYTKALQLVTNLSSSKSNTPNTIYKETRLSMPERLCFLVGVLCLSIVAFPSYINSPSDQSLFLYNAFANTNSILLVCPILSFFSRCSTTWTPALTLSCGLFVCLGSFLSSLAPIWTANSSAYKNLSIASSVFINIAAFIYVCVCVVALRASFSTAASSSAKNNRSKDLLAAKDMMSEAQFRSNVVTAHMFATFIILLINSIWYWYIQELTPHQLGIFVYVSVGSIAITYLIEFRVRRTEVAASLVRKLRMKNNLIVQFNYY